MIVTVTMNPALDKTANVTKLLPGGLNRLGNLRTDPGGKGINVSKMISVLGGKSLCTGFVGGSSGRALCTMLEDLGLAAKFLQLSGNTRTNLKLIEGNGCLTELNEPGISVSELEISQIMEQLEQLTSPEDIVVLGGSLPEGAGPDTYRHFVKRLTDKGCRVILDADGEALRRGLEAAPHIVKPNRFELLQYFKLPQDTPDSQLPELGRLIVNNGVALVVISLGSDGAIFLSQDHSVLAKALPVSVQSTVGAGDSMVGALAYGLELELGLEDMVRLSMAASIAAVTTTGTNPPDLDLVNRLKTQIEITYI